MVVRLLHADGLPREDLTEIDLAALVVLLKSAFEHGKGAKASDKPSTESDQAKLVERALGAELIHHLTFDPRAAKPNDILNHRNRTIEKTVLTDDGTVDIAVPLTRR